MERIDSTIAFGYLKALSFERRSGTPQEAKAARMIADFLRGMKLWPRVEKFRVDTFSQGEGTLEVTAPFRKRYKAWPVGYSRPTPAGGIAGELTYVENPAADILGRMRGKVVLMEGGLRKKLYEALKGSGAKAVIRMSAPDRLVHGKYAYEIQRRLGRLPGVMISYEDGLELVGRGARRVRIASRAPVTKTISQNVIAEIPGDRYPREVMVVGAHYDSVMWSSGAADNAAGSALALALARRFAAAPLARTLRFIWFGCEEIGLEGSYRYVEKHRRRMKDVRFMLNLDVGGSTIGRVAARVTGTRKLANYVEVLGRELGAFSEATQGVASSDSTPFARCGVQALNLSRRGGGASYIHTRGDSLEHCGPAAFDLIGAAAAEFLSRVGNAVEFPFERALPKRIQDELKKYITDNSGREYKYLGETVDD